MCSMQLQISLRTPTAPRRRCCEDNLGRRRHCGAPLDTFPERSAAGTGTACPRPRRIILVRHGQSLGNVDESVYTNVPDPDIQLTDRGWQEAEDCGRRIRALLDSDPPAAATGDWKVYFYVSPYRRALQTLRALGRAFDRHRIAGVREEPRLREQDFGNFQDRERMQIEKTIRLRYGRFFYRFPNGESAADVYDRITGFRETLRSDIDIGRFQPPGERNENMNLVIVSHGLTLRVFLMRWYKWTVEQFEGLQNLGNGGMMVMKTGSGGRYSLLAHHTAEELQSFGLTEKMLADQNWQKTARPGELNYDCLTYPWLTSMICFMANVLIFVDLVINHGVSVESIEKTKAEAEELFPIFSFRKHRRMPLHVIILFKLFIYSFPALKRIWCEVFNPPRFKMLEVISVSQILAFRDYSAWKVQGDDQGQHAA